MLTEEEKNLAKSATWSERYTWGNGEEWCIVALVAQHRGAVFVQGPYGEYHTDGEKNFNIMTKAYDEIEVWLGSPNETIFELWHTEKSRIFQRATY